LVRLADPLAQLDDWHQRIVCLHGKDASIDRPRIARWGIGSSQPWSWHRTPGFGETDWTFLISKLRMHGFTGSIDIEGWHDPVYRDELEIPGQVAALQYLQRCRGGGSIQRSERKVEAGMAAAL
jgi:sugar phosphate isomerase/epimerase